jgi:hypothetical protein
VWTDKWYNNNNNNVIIIIDNIHIDANNDNANVPFSTGVRHLTSWTVDTWYGQTLFNTNLEGFSAVSYKTDVCFFL